jgi:formate dehydrogenase iron-sulfur subunit
MTNDKCRHCAEPTCIERLPKGSYAVDPFGAVVYNTQAKAKLADVFEACPFGIPTQSKRTGTIVKCTLCNDRIAEGMEPACSQTCPTKAIMWGERDAMMKYAKDRIAWLRAKDQDRTKSDKIKLYPSEDFPCHVRWILLDDLEKHGMVGDW